MLSPRGLFMSEKAAQQLPTTTPQKESRPADRDYKSPASDSWYQKRVGAAQNKKLEASCESLRS